MRAIRVFECGPPEVMQLAEREALTPGPGQVLIQVGAAGVNPVDTYIRAGAYTLSAPLPYTPGWECAGQIIARGEGVTQLEVGQHVYTTRTVSGAYAEQAIADAATTHPMPPSLDMERGAAIGIAYATAYHALMQLGRAQAKDRVLIHGASGGVGLAAVQLAAAAGMTVVGSASSEAGRQLILAQGAHAAVDHRDPDHLEQAKALIHAPGFDLILEMAAHLNLREDLKALADRGKVMVVGSRGELMFNPRDLMTKGLQVQGVMLYGMRDVERAQLHQALYDGLDRGQLNPIIGARYPLKDAAVAHHAIMDKTRSAAGKIILTL